MSKKLFELAFAIGGKLDPSFAAANSKAAAHIAQLQKKSSEAMAFGRLQREHATAVRNFGAAANNMGSAWGGVARSIIGPLQQIGLVAAGAATGVYALAARFAQMGDEANKNAAKLGITTRAYGELKYAADQSGTSSEQFNSSMQRLTRNLVQWNAQGKRGVELNGQQILSFRRANGEMKDTSEILMDASEAYRRIQDPARKAEFAIAMFGNAGLNMVPMLEQGEAGIAELRKEAERLGVVFDQDAADSASLFRDSITRAKNAVVGLGISVFSQLNPYLTKVNEIFTEWIATNREFIAQKVQEYIQVVTEWVRNNKDAIVALKDDVVNFIKRIGEWIEQNGGLVEVMKKVVIAFAAFKALGIAIALGGAIAATVKFVAAFKAVITTTLVLVKAFAFIVPVLKGIGIAIVGISAPIAGIIAGVVALGVGIYALVKNWDWVVEKSKAALASVGQFVQNLIDRAKAIFNTLPGFITAPIRAIYGFFVNEFDKIKEAFGGGFFNGIKEILSGVPTLFLRMINHVISIVTGVDLIATGREWIQKFIDGILGAIRNAAGAVKDAVTGLIPEGVRNLVGGAASAVRNILPRFGEGGIATSPSIVAEDGKPELVIPLTKPARALELVRHLIPILPTLNNRAATSAPTASPAEQLQQAAGITNNNTRNVNSSGGTFTFAPSVTVNGGGDPGAIRSAVMDGLANAKNMFEQWIAEHNHHNARVAMA